jgi:hypothetical protein
MLAIVNSRSLSCEADGQSQFNTIRLRYASMNVGIIAPADAKHNVIRDLKPGSPLAGIKQPSQLNASTCESHPSET